LKVAQEEVFDMYDLTVYKSEKKRSAKGAQQGKNRNITRRGRKVAK